jgi:hypothetical protein
MSNESRFLATLGKLWKNKYAVDWCELCRTAIIICPKCQNSSCNGGGCEECLKDWAEFKEYKRRVENYLTEDEIKIYNKCEALKDLIVKTIREEEKGINWEKIQKEGKLSINDEKLFCREIENSKWKNLRDKNL